MATAARDVSVFGKLSRCVSEMPLGTLRWLSSSAELGPDALAALVFKIVALGLFIGGWALSARISAGRPAQRLEPLPWATPVKAR